MEGNKEKKEDVAYLEDNTPFKGKKKYNAPLQMKQKNFPVKKDIQLSTMGDMSKVLQGVKGFSSEPPPIDTLRVAGPPTPQVLQGVKGFSSEPPPIDTLRVAGPPTPQVLQGVKGFSSEPPPIDTLREAGPPTLHRRSTQVVGTSEDCAFRTTSVKA